MAPTKQAAIVGVYLTEQAVQIDRSSQSLQLEALKGALADAGLEAKDLDGIIATGGESDAGRWSRQLGKPLVDAGKSCMGATAVAEAVAHINAGLCEVVVVVHGNSGFRIGPDQVRWSGSVVPDKAPRLDEWNASVWGMYIIPWYAQMARRHMYEFGTTSEQLANVAVTFRHHATLNPRSIMGKRGTITIEDVLNSRMVCEPLHLLDCCLANHGAYAFVVTTAERARNLKKKPVYVLGAASAVWNSPYEDLTPNYYPSPATITGPKAMAQAGVTHDDLDVLGIYDCFTITVVRLMEDLGFCKLGEGGSFVAEGNLTLNGKWPTNLDGGLLSHSHNGLPGGMHVVEVVRQLRGEVEPQRQVPNAKIGFCHDQGFAVLGRHGSCVLAVD
ncbi:MAG: thiolase family protein [Chloroflexi bacterium]|nr:thiolase family protein [Chloroflexota bacterium]